PLHHIGVIVNEHVRPLRSDGPREPMRRHRFLDRAFDVILKEGILIKPRIASRQCIGRTPFEGLVLGPDESAIGVRAHAQRGASCQQQSRREHDGGTRYLPHGMTPPFGSANLMPWEGLVNTLATSRCAENPRISTREISQSCREGRATADRASSSRLARSLL